MSMKKFLAKARAMPARIHKHEGQDFDQAKSEVMDWLASTPEARRFLYRLAEEYGAIWYEPEMGHWQGVGGDWPLKRRRHGPRRDPDD